MHLPRGTQVSLGIILRPGHGFELGKRTGRKLRQGQLRCKHTHSRWQRDAAVAARSPRSVSW